MQSGFQKKIRIRLIIYKMEKHKTHEAEIPVEDRLRALYSLQLVDSEIDKIKTLRGELPLEVQDLEDEIAGLETRLGNLKEEVVVLEKSVQKKHNEISDSEALIKKYEEQQNNVRNNREYDSLSKEIEFQTLEIEQIPGRGRTDGGGAGIGVHVGGGGGDHLLEVLQGEIQISVAQSAEPASDERIDAFGRTLADRGITVMVRKSRGRDIRAACGQLAVEGMKRSAAQRLADAIG